MSILVLEEIVGVEPGVGAPASAACFLDYLQFSAPYIFSNL